MDKYYALKPEQMCMLFRFNVNRSVSKLIYFLKNISFIK